MKSNVINKFIIAGALVMGTGLTACEDYLTVLPSDRITEDDFWKSKSDLDNVRSAAYRKMCTEPVIGRLLYWGELRADNLAQNDMTKSEVEMLRKGVLHPTDGMFDWSHFYTGINYCNKVLEKGEEMTQPGKEVDPSFRQGDWKPIKAEMLSVRALYYFNLVKAFRAVPFVEHSISTDAEAKREGHKEATLGTNILGKLIADLEEAKDYASNDFSSAMERKGRFTKRSVHALLADMYLWRSCMLSHAMEKGDTIVRMDSLGTDTLQQGTLDAMSKEDLNKVIEHCDYVLQSFQKDYDKDLLTHPEWNEDEDRNKDFPYMNFMSSKRTFMVNDLVYNDLFGGQKNSKFESVFELQFDKSNLQNTAYNTYLSHSESGALKPTIMVGAGEMTSSAANTFNPERGFGKTDIRLVETFQYTPAQSQRAPYHKNIALSVIVPNLQNVVDEEFSVSFDYRPKASMDANWPVYRLTDIMLMKAEAIARLNAVTAAVEANKVNDSHPEVLQLAEGFNLVNAIFQRCNPVLKHVEEVPGADKNTDGLRFKDAREYVVGKTSEALLKLVYNERQREFVGEGKRWFDIVRQVEATNNIQRILTDYINLPKEVKSRLRSIYAMYVPIYSEEMKVNGVENGGKLHQNPVWDRYTVK